MRCEVFPMLTIKNDIDNIFLETLLLSLNKFQTSSKSITTWINQEHGTVCIESLYASISIQGRVEKTAVCITTQKISFPWRFILQIWPNPQFLAGLVTFNEKTLNGKLHFLCNAYSHTHFIYENPYFKCPIFDYFAHCSLLNLMSLFTEKLVRNTDRVTMGKA